MKIRACLGLGGWLLAGIFVSFGDAWAADLPVLRAEAPVCVSPCPVTPVYYVRHRELRMGYPSGFDPRAVDEPRYFYGGMRTYVRYMRPAPAW